MFSELKTLKRSASDSEKSSRYITVQNMLEGAFWLAAQTPHTFCYVPPSVCDRKYCNRSRNERVTIIFVRFIISLFHYILKQLCTSVSVTSSGYLLRREAETLKYPLLTTSTSVKNVNYNILFGLDLYRWQENSKIYPKKFENESYKRRMQNTNFWCMLKIVLVSKARKFDNSLWEKVVKNQLCRCLNMFLTSISVDLTCEK